MIHIISNIPIVILFPILEKQESLKQPGCAEDQDARRTSHKGYDDCGQVEP